MRSYRNDLRHGSLLAVWAIVAIGAVSFLGGCGSAVPTTPAASDDSMPKAPAGATVQVLINDFVVQYDGRTVADGETTFRYTVHGTGVGSYLRYFALELPDCAPSPSGYQPVDAVTIGVDPRTGIYGIRWDLPIEIDDTVGREFAITFAGDVSEGEVRATVKTAPDAEVGLVPGPCAGSYVLSGVVFVDVDADGLPGEIEAGIGDVVVDLLQDGVLVESASTDGLGRFSFLRGAGDYTVRIDLESYPGAFNDVLRTSFDATGLLEYPISVGPDALAIDFGFAPRAEQIIDELETGELLSNGRSARFWQRELRLALSNARAPRFYDNDTILGFLAAIQQLYLDEVFQFTPGNEMREAWEILRGRSRDPLVGLLRELLAAEFNHVAGLGLQGDDRPLQGVLIAWGEAIVVSYQAVIQNAGAVAADGTIELPEFQVIQLSDLKQVQDATRLFAVLNTGGGGSADE